MFGIPIGVLGASFEQVMSDLNDDTAQLEASAREALEEAAASSASRSLGTSLEQKAYEFVNTDDLVRPPSRSLLGIGIRGRYLFSVHLPSADKRRR